MSDPLQPRDHPAPQRSLRPTWFRPLFPRGGGEPQLGRHLVVSRKPHSRAPKRLWDQHSFRIPVELRFRVRSNRWVQNHRSIPKEIHLLPACHQMHIPELRALSQLTPSPSRLSGTKLERPSTPSRVFPFMLVTNGEKKNLSFSATHMHTPPVGRVIHQRASPGELFLNTRSRWGECSSLGRQKDDDHQGRKRCFSERNPHKQSFENGGILSRLSRHLATFRVSLMLPCPFTLTGIPPLSPSSPPPTPAPTGQAVVQSLDLDRKGDWRFQWSRDAGLTLVSEVRERHPRGFSLSTAG